MQSPFHERIRPSLFLLIGAPCSGKTTWRQKVYTSSPHRQTTFISSDDIISQAAKDAGVTYNQAFAALDHSVVTEELWRQFDKATTSNHDVVVDRTNMYKGSRARFLNRIPRHYKIIAIVFERPLSILLKRNIYRDSVEDKMIPEDVIKQMIDTYETPSWFYDGFDIIYHVPHTELVAG